MRVYFIVIYIYKTIILEKSGQKLSGIHLVLREYCRYLLYCYLNKYIHLALISKRS